MKQESAGIMIYRRKADGIQVLLAHPGGPFWRNKDEGAWTIPKGELAGGEDVLQAAIRETKEELGITVEPNACIRLESVRLKSGKLIHAFATELDVDAGSIKSNHFEMEWPPRSGKKQSFPEIDRAEWFGVEEAKRKLNPGQIGLIENLQELLK